MLHSAQRNPAFSHENPAFSHRRWTENPAFSHQRWTENQAFSQKNLHLLGIQMTFDLHSCPAPSTIPNRSNLWYDKTDELEFSDECCIICDKELKSTEYSFGVCKHIVHKHCLLKTERCPICKKQWETDSSPVEFEKELNRLQENLSIECILEKSCTDFLDRQQTGQRIVPKRKLRDI